MNEGTELDVEKLIANLRADAALRIWYIRTHKVENAPPRWVVEPGSRLRFKSAKSGSVWGDVFVPHAPKEQYTQYYSIAELPDAI